MKFRGRCRGFEPLGLVGNQPDLASTAAQLLTDNPVLWSKTIANIHHEENGIAFVYSLLALWLTSYLTERLPETELNSVVYQLQNATARNAATEDAS